MAFLSIDTLEAENQNILARFDFNVPLKNEKITDATRIDLALPTIKALLAKNPKRLILMSHLGRPNSGKNSKYSLEPIASYLAEALEQDVLLTESPSDSDLQAFLKIHRSQIVLLENLRFDKGEEACSLDFCEKLAALGDVFVNDAFGTAHRKHASTYGLVAFFPRKSYAGYLLLKEVEALTIILEKAQKPFNAILGGAKVSDKIKTIEKLLPLVQNLCIGGAMAYPFLAAKGVQIGKSLCGDEDIELAKRTLQNDTYKKIKLPIDHIISDSPNGDAKTTNDETIPNDKMGLDIGPKTVAHYRELLSDSKTLFWNGPMGMFEKENFSNGTMEMAKVMAECPGYTVIGGGDSVSAIKKSGLDDKIKHVSTGGGASLEMIEKGSLPGVTALKFGLTKEDLRA